MVRPRPPHWNRENAEAFADAAVAAAYQYRAPYPAAAFDHLLTLLPERCRAVLDVGAGTGAVARPLAPHVGRVDAVDPSVAMVNEGKHLPDGSHPHLHWIVGRAEDAPLDRQYGLVTAGAALHWMEWEVVLPRWHDALVPGGYLAVLGTQQEPASWQEALDALIARSSVVDNWQETDLIAELTVRGLFAEGGRWQSEPYPWRQSRVEYIEALHSTSSLSRARMGEEVSAEFDAAVTALLPATVSVEVVATIVWGWPLI